MGIRAGQVAAEGREDTGEKNRSLREMESRGVADDEYIMIW